MIRRIIEIDEAKCNGCGLCANACHESAIAIVDGKAKLIRDDYCDGLGDCLPTCPTGAICFIEREAAPYDEVAVKRNQLKAKMNDMAKKNIDLNICENGDVSDNVDSSASFDISSKLTQWPVQIKLVPVSAPYFENADLLIAADCTAYAYGNFHNRFMDKKITIIGCPKLDDIDYSQKLTEIIKNNNIKSITIVKMEVPCCRGIEIAAKTAIQNSGKNITANVVTISIEGQIQSFNCGEQ